MFPAATPGRDRAPSAAAGARAAIALLGMAAVTAACSGGSSHAAPGTPTGGQGTLPGTPSPAVSYLSREALAARYLAVAKDPNHHLDVDFDGLEKSDHSNLALAKAQLRDMAATERRFDRLLLAIRFPPPIEATAHALVQANESRAAVADRAAASVSLQQLRGYEQRLTQANGPLEAAVRLIRKQLGLPPPDTS